MLDSYIIYRSLMETFDFSARLQFRVCDTGTYVYTHVPCRIMEWFLDVIAGRRAAPNLRDTQGGENAKATVIRESYPSAMSVCMYVCMYVSSGAHITAWEIWIILSCDCPCGDPIKIRVDFRTTACNRKKWQAPGIYPSAIPFSQNTIYPE